MSSLSGGMGRGRDDTLHRTFRDGFSQYASRKELNAKGKDQKSDKYCFHPIIDNGIHRIHS